MADPGWGVASGFLTGTQEMQAIQMNQFKLAEAPVSLEREQVSLESEKTALNTQKAALAAQQKMMQMLSSQPQSSADPVADAAAKLSQVADAELKTGQVEAATRTLAEVSKMQENQSLIASRKFEQTQKVGEYVTSLLDNVAASGYTKAAWDQANSIATVMTGQKSPFASMLPANATPEQVKSVVDKVRTGYTTAIQKAQIDRDKALTHEAEVKTENDRLERPLIAARADAERALAEQRRKAAGEPKAVDTKDLVSLIQGDPDNGKVAKPAAEALAIGMQDEMEKYKKDGLTTAQAAQAAYQNAKKRGDLKTLSRPAPQQEAAVSLIDDLIDQVNRSQGKTLGITGVGGMVERTRETAMNIFGGSDDTSGHDFESKLKTLQLMLPKALNVSGQFSKVRAAEISKIARGLSPGDTAQNTISGLEQLKGMLAGEAATSTQAPQVLKFDAQGNPLP